MNRKSLILLIIILIGIDIHLKAESNIDCKRVALVLDNSYSTKKYKNHDLIRESCSNFASRIELSSDILDVYTFAEEFKNIYRSMSKNNVREIINEKYLQGEEKLSTDFNPVFRSSLLLRDYDIIIFVCSGPSKNLKNDFANNVSSAKLIFISLGNMDSSIYQNLIDNLNYKSTEYYQIPRIINLPNVLKEIILPTCSKLPKTKSTKLRLTMENSIHFNEKLDVKEFFLYDNLGRLIKHSNGNSPVKLDKIPNNILFGIIVLNSGRVLHEKLIYID